MANGNNKRGGSGNPAYEKAEVARKRGPTVKESPRAGLQAAFGSVWAGGPGAGLRNGKNRSGRRQKGHQCVNLTRCEPITIFPLSVLRYRAHHENGSVKKKTVRVALEEKKIAQSAIMGRLFAHPELCILQTSLIGELMINFLLCIHITPLAQRRGASTVFD